MKTLSTIIISALLLAISGTAMAKPSPVPVSTVTKGSTTTVSVTVSNPSRTEVLPGIVNIQAFDEAGAVVANLGAPVVVDPKSELTVSREWQAPNYATGLTWKAKVVPFREAPIDHSFGWTYPRLQHRMTSEAKNPVTCSNCHHIEVVDKDDPMSCYKCHGHKWN